MATAEPAKKLMTLEEFLALPEDDGNHYELIAGELRVEDQAMTTRHPKHSYCETNIASFLKQWLDGRSELTGVIVSGEVRCHLGAEPATIVGIDVAFFEGQSAVQQLRTAPHFNIVPVLAVEILSPSVRLEAVNEKTQLYLTCGVPMVWNIDPDARTVTVWGAGVEPVLFNIQQRIAALPALPGFDVAVADLFGLIG